MHDYGHLITTSLQDETMFRDLRGRQTYGSCFFRLLQYSTVHKPESEGVGGDQPT